MKILVKIGTTILTTNKGELDLNNLRQLTHQISQIIDQNHHLILVTSGAITCGAELINSSLQTIPEKQAAASIGQLLLMNEYSLFFKSQGIQVGQLLLTKDGLLDKNKKTNALNTINTLLNHGCIPIINENDSVATNEIKFGDNDELSSLVAILCNVDRYILLSDIDGLYTDDPSQTKTASLIPSISHINDQIKLSAKGPKNKQGSGGMISKINAAEQAMNHGITVTIANGRQPQILQDILDNKSIGTTFKTIKSKQ
jgi:glutamate 5-kinase